MKNLINDIKGSFFDRDFYASLPKRTFGQALVFILVINIVSCLIFFGRMSITILPDIFKLTQADIMVEEYPDDLVVTVKDGVVSTNVDEPYFVKNEKYDETKKDEYKNFVAINTKSKPSIEEIDSYSAFVVILKDKVVIQKSKNETRTFGLNEVKDITITKEKIIGWANKAIKWIKILSVPVFLILALFGALFSVAFYLVIMLLGSFITMLVSRIRGLKLSYSESYVVSIYALGPLMVLYAIMSLFGVISSSFLLGTLIFIATVAASLGKKEESNSEVLVETGESIEKKDEGEPQVPVEIDKTVEDKK